MNTPDIAYKVGNEFAPYHPQASHVAPDYRDGWNACFKAAADELERLRTQVAPAEALLNAATLDWPSSPATRRKVLEAADTLRRSLVATAAGNVATPEQTSGSSAAAPVAGQSLTVGDELTNEQILAIWDAHLVPAFGKQGFSPIVFARKLIAALPEPAAQAKPVAWQERQEVSKGKFGEWYDRPTGWSLTRPREIDSGGIRYQFRPLYTAPPSHPPAQGVDAVAGAEPCPCATQAPAA